MNEPGGRQPSRRRASDRGLARRHTRHLRGPVAHPAPTAGRMNDRAVIDTSKLGRRGAARGHPKGRQVDAQALLEVRALLGEAPRRRDLLVEHLHRIQDRYACVASAHLVASASEMKLSLAEVYEVATFYHHFDVMKEGESPPPEITVRVCETLSCELAGASALRADLMRACGANVRVIGAPCVGRCEHAPAAVVGRNPIDRATVPAVVDAVAKRHVEPDIPRHVDYAAYRAGGGYRTLVSCVRGERTVDAVIAALEELGAAGTGRRRLSGGSQVADRARRIRAAADGGEHRRGRARHVQGPLLSRARPPSLPRGHADRRLGGRHRRRSTSICATSTPRAARS